MRILVLPLKVLDLLGPFLKLNFDASRCYTNLISPGLSPSHQQAHPPTLAFSIPLILNNMPRQFRIRLIINRHIHQTHTLEL